MKNNLETSGQTRDTYNATKNTDNPKNPNKEEMFYGGSGFNAKKPQDIKKFDDGSGFNAKKPQGKNISEFLSNNNPPSNADDTKELLADSEYIQEEG